MLLTLTLTWTASSSSSFTCRANLEVLTSTNLSLRCFKSSGNNSSTSEHMHITVMKGFNKSNKMTIYPYHLNVLLQMNASLVFAQALAFLLPTLLWLQPAKSEKKNFKICSIKSSTLIACHTFSEEDLSWTRSQSLFFSRTALSSVSKWDLEVLKWKY